MPPKGSRMHLVDHKPDSAKEKGPGSGLSATKMRRGASQTSGSHHREAASVAPTSAPSQAVAEALAPTTNWSSFDRKDLHAYRRQHQISTPTSFVSPYHQWVFTGANSIGLHSPTMVRKLQAKRQTKDALAKTVRKHFNGLGIQENDVIVDLIYKVRSERAAQAGGPSRRGGIVSE